MPFAIGWLSIIQEVNSELSHENGFQLLSVDSSIWDIEETVCTDAPNILTNSDGSGDGLQYLKCTAEVTLISNDGLAAFCTPPNERGNFGCVMSVDVTDGAYDSHDNAAASRQRYRNRNRNRKRRELAPGAVTIRHRLYTGAVEPFDLPLTLAHRDFRILVEPATVDEGLSVGDTFGKITLTDFEGLVAFEEWQGSTISMSSGNDVLGLQQVGGLTSGTVPEWQFEVLNAAPLLPGVTASIAVEFSVVDSNLPAGLPAVFQQTLPINPFPAPQLVQFWFDTAISETDVAEQLEAIKQTIIANGMPAVYLKNISSQAVHPFFLVDIWVYGDAMKNQTLSTIESAAGIDMVEQKASFRATLYAEGDFWWLAPVVDGDGSNNAASISFETWWLYAIFGSVLLCCGCGFLLTLCRRHGREEKLKLKLEHEKDARALRPSYIEKKSSVFYPADMFNDDDESRQPRRQSQQQRQPQDEDYIAVGNRRQSSWLSPAQQALSSMSWMNEPNQFADDDEYIAINNNDSPAKRRASMMSNQFRSSDDEYIAINDQDSPAKRRASMMSNQFIRPDDEYIAVAPPPSTAVKFRRRNSQLSDEDRMHLYKVFEQLDAQDNGRIDVNDLERGWHHPEVYVVCGCVRGWV